MDRRYRYSTSRCPVLIADFQNTSNDTTFDGTLEPIVKLALEGAGFITALDRAGIRRSLDVRPPDVLNERAAQDIAVKNGVGVILAGSIGRQGSGYSISMKVTQAVTGNVMTTVSNRASSKDQVLSVATRLADSVRESLGGDTSDDKQRFAMDTLSATSVDAVRDYAAGMIAFSNSKFEEARRQIAESRRSRSEVRHGLDGPGNGRRSTWTSRRTPSNMPRWQCSTSTR